MIICSNCGYENNPDDALSCSLCGKVFRKEVRKDKEEQDKQPMSKVKKIYGEWKKGVKKDAELDPGGTGIIGLCRTIGKLVRNLREAKGDELRERIIVLCTFLIAIILGVILAPNIGLEKAFDWKDSSRKAYYAFGKLILLIYFIFFVLLFIYFIFQKLLKNFFSKEE